MTDGIVLYFELEEQPPEKLIDLWRSDDTYWLVAPHGLPEIHFFEKETTFEEANRLLDEHVDEDG